MKIVIFTEDLPPCLGGIAQWANGVARSLVTQGHTVTIYMRKDPLKNSSLHNDESYDLIPMQDWKWNQLRSIYIAYYTILALLNKPQLLIATAWNIGAFSALISKKFSCKTMIIYHGLEVTKNLSAKRRLKLRHCLERADYNIAVSQFTAESIKARFKSIDAIKVIHNGIDTNRFYPGEKPNSLIEKWKLKDKIILMTLARVIERKGHQAVIKVLPHLLESMGNIVYLIAGGFDLNYRKKLEQIVSTNNLAASVIFTGFIPDSEILDYYNLCDVYIMLSRDSQSKGDTEGFGITFLEANACEKPVIGSNIHGIPDAIEHNKSGFLINPDDSKALIEIVEKLLTEPTYAKQIGQQGLERIKAGFTWDHVADKLIELVEDE